jgi:shikimate dehydrogenase
LKKTHQFGLVGKNISYSFSRKYFATKFESEVFENYSYENFDLNSITEFPEIFKKNVNIKGLNITIPYKEEVIPFLDKLSKQATAIGAVNTVKITKKGKLKGYNSDWYGFKKAIKPFLKNHHKKALILGTGGASKAIAYALEQMKITYSFVSREANSNSISYELLNQTTFENHQIIINTTPLGTFPDVGEFPFLPYSFFTSNHIAFDVIYNPEKTQFLKRAEKNGATIVNGHSMLVNQAEKSWKIWNK